MISVKVDFKDLTNYIEKISQKKNLFQNISDYLTNPQEEGTFYHHFDNYGNQPGRLWADLKASTIRDKQRKGYDVYPMLVRNGRLQDSFLKGNENINNISDDYLEFGSRNPYAQYHENGTPNMVRRQLLYTEDEVFISRIEKIMQDFVSEN